MAAGAAAAGAAAAGTAAESATPDAAPALIAARAQALLIGLLRLALAAAGLAIVVGRGLDAGVALGLAALGVGLVVLARAAGPRRRRERDTLEQAEHLVGPARVVTHMWALVLAAYPSTIGLTVLVAVAIVVNGSLAALLAGLLAGIAVPAFVAAAELAVWERRHGGRLLAERGRDGRAFLQPLGRS